MSNSDENGPYEINHAYPVACQNVDDAEVKKALEFTQRLASGVLADHALVPILRCEHNPVHGVWRKTAHFVLDLYNVSPVVLQVDDCFLTLEGWSEFARMQLGQPLFRSERERGGRKVEQILPGERKIVEFECPIKMVGDEPGEGRAVLVNAQLEVEVQGPANHLCCTVRKGAACWMPWRELAQAAT